MTDPTPDAPAVGLLTRDSVALLKAGDIYLCKMWGPVRFDRFDDSERRAFVTDTQGQVRLMVPAGNPFIGRPDADGWMPAPEGGWKENPVPGQTIQVLRRYRVGLTHTGKSYPSDAPYFHAAWAHRPAGLGGADDIIAIRIPGLTPAPCFECESTERVGTACKPCNPEITDPAFGLTPAAGEGTAPITRDEMISLFGEEMPLAAVKLLWDAPGDKTLGDIRKELRALATTPTPDRKDDLEPVAWDYGGLEIFRRQLAPIHGEGVPLYGPDAKARIEALEGAVAALDETVVSAVERRAVLQARFDATVKALRVASEHIQHMAAWITKTNASDVPLHGYSFEALGEDKWIIDQALASIQHDGGVK